jgi:hypothetical protein
MFLKLIFFFQLQFVNWALATGVYIVVALSLERYVSVVFPLHFRMWNSPQRAMKAICVAYIVPALFYIPYGIGRYSVSEKLNARGELVYGAIDSEVSKTLAWQVKTLQEKTGFTFFKVKSISKRDMAKSSTISDLQVDP